MKTFINEERSMLTECKQEESKSLKFSTALEQTYFTSIVAPHHGNDDGFFFPALESVNSADLDLQRT